MADVVYASEKLIPSFHQALDQVAREKIYLEMTEAPPLVIYQRGGFAFEGVSKDYRRVDGVVFDALLMAKFKK